MQRTALRAAADLPVGERCALAEARSAAPIRGSGRSAAPSRKAGPGVSPARDRSARSPLLRPLDRMRTARPPRSAALAASA